MPTTVDQLIPDGLVCLTLDAGVKSQHEFVAPILKELGFGATFYITEGLRFLGDKTRYMSWEEVADLDHPWVHTDPEVFENTCAT